MDITGEGFENRSPAMLFNSDRGNGTDSGTTWELLFTEGVYFKTEGGDNEDENPQRVNGIQPDGIRDFRWIQTQTAIDHTHTLTAKNTSNPICVSGNTNGTNDNHYHTLEEALDGSTGADSHNHEGTISMTPSRVVVNAPSTGNRGVGPVVPASDGYWGEPYGEWSDEITGDTWQFNTGHDDIYDGYDVMIIKENTWDVDWGDWVDIGSGSGSSEYFYNVTLPAFYASHQSSRLEEYNVRTESGGPDNISYTFEKRNGVPHNNMDGIYKRRTCTWHDPIPESGSVNAVSSVNTSFVSFSVNTTGISLGGDGSHSHTISIPTSGSSNENGHTHTVSASGIADINVSGSTISGGAHSHTFIFKYSELKDISNQNTRIASETTVKNRKMRIWRRTA
jgi:hypothetical protein